MTLLSDHILLLCALARLSHGQNCPLLGPAYPPITDPASSQILHAAKAVVDEGIAQILSSPQFGNSAASFSIQVFSLYSDEPIYEYYHTNVFGTNTSLAENHSVGPETLYRIASISKVVSVYAILARISDKYWNEPVTKYVPELEAAAGNQPSNAVDSARWSEVTLGAVASHMSGIGSRYAFGDLSTIIPSGTPGLPDLNETDTIQCGAVARTCTRAESMEMILRKQPVFPSYQSPAYSDMAFQLLAYAIENITGQQFATLVEDELLKPLGLTRTFLSTPTNDSNAVIVDGWTADFGDLAPTGGYIQSIADLSKLGKSILDSSLLSPQATRKWLKPISHTANPSVSVGRPWEILRLNVPVSSTSSTTRLVDVYSKGGAFAQYFSLLSLSPDHSMGIALLTAGPSAEPIRQALQQLLTTTWVAAGEHAAREHARVNFAGNYTLPDNSSAEITLLPNEPALFLASLVSNGTDMLAFVGGLVSPGSAAGIKGWLYPTTLAESNRLAFRAVYGRLGQPAGEMCGSWAVIDGIRYGGNPADLFIFKVGDDGRAKAIEIPILKKTLRRTE